MSNPLESTPFSSVPYDPARVYVRHSSSQASLVNLRSAPRSQSTSQLLQPSSQIVSNILSTQSIPMESRPLLSQGEVRQYASVPHSSGMSLPQPEHIILSSTPGISRLSTPLSTPQSIPVNAPVISHQLHSMPPLPVTHSYAQSVQSQPSQPQPILTQPQPLQSQPQPQTIQSKPQSIQAPQVLPPSALPTLSSRLSRLEEDSSILENILEECQSKLKSTRSEIEAIRAEMVQPPASHPLLDKDKQELLDIIDKQKQIIEELMKRNSKEHKKKKDHEEKKKGSKHKKDKDAAK